MLFLSKVDRLSSKDKILCILFGGSTVHAVISDVGMYPSDNSFCNHDLLSLTVLVTYQMLHTNRHSCSILDTWFLFLMLFYITL